MIKVPYSWKIMQARLEKTIAKFYGDYREFTDETEPCKKPWN